MWIALLIFSYYDIMNIRPQMHVGLDMGFFSLLEENTCGTHKYCLIKVTFMSTYDKFWCRKKKNDDYLIICGAI